MQKQLSKINYKALLAFSAIYIIWGTTYLVIRIGLESVPPFLMASMRYILAGFLLLLFCRIKGEALFSKYAINNMLLGAFMLTLGQGVLFWAEKYISSGLTAVFSSTLPIWYIIADTKKWRTYFRSKLTMVSILLGIIGIIILFQSPSGNTEQHAIGMAVLASIVAVGSCLCWAIGSLYFTYHHTEGSLYVNVGWQLVGGTVACLLISLITGECNIFSFKAVTTNSWLAILYLAIAGSIVAFIALYWLLARRPAPIVGTYAYVNPVIAVLLGYLIADEKITTTQVIGMIVILIAAYLANSVKSTTVAVKR
jgi:drug/metabolite transporter (DMT)-like permease